MLSQEANGGALTAAEARGRPFSHHTSPLIDAMARYAIAHVSELLLLLPIIALYFLRADERVQAVDDMPFCCSVCDCYAVWRF
jgi:hypothetical protein